MQQEQILNKNEMEKVNLCIVIAAFVLACACSGGNETATFRRSVYLTQPAQVSGNRVKTYSGIVEAAHEINLGFKTAGQISHIHVKEGDYVHRGQLLAELDDADYRLAVEALQVQYDQLADETKRTKQLFESKSVSANDYEKAIAGLKQLGAQLQANKNKLNYTRLYAPTDGYVQAVNFSRSEMVDAGTSVFQIMDVSHFEVVTDIPVSEYLQHKNFTEFYCRRIDHAQKIPMTLLSIVPKADGNQLYRLRLAFTEMPDMKLTAGMNIEVGIDIANNSASSGFTLPFSAVFQKEGKAYVWVLRNDSTVTQRSVTLDNTDVAGHIRVTGGLAGDEQIVRSGGSVLLEGEKVRVIGEPSETNVGGLL